MTLVKNRHLPLLIIIPQPAFTTQPRTLFTRRMPPSPWIPACRSPRALRPLAEKHQSLRGILKDRLLQFRPIRKAVRAPARGFETGLDFFAYFFYQEKK
jgi:hypothetical protein